MNNLLLQQGVNLMLFGMGTVFVFLTILVFVTQAMSYVVGNYFAEAEVNGEADSRESLLQQPAAIDAKKLAIIKKAIHLHREKKG